MPHPIKDDIDAWKEATFDADADAAALVDADAKAKASAELKVQRTLALARNLRKIGVPIYGGDEDNDGDQLEYYSLDGVTVRVDEIKSVDTLVPDDGDVTPPEPTPTPTPEPTPTPGPEPSPAPGPDVPPTDATLG
jgi:hypothetical protein